MYVKTQSSAAGDVVIFFIFLFTVFYAFAWSSVLALYSIEIFPTGARPKANGVRGVVQAGFQLLNQYVNPIGIAAIGWKYYIVFNVLIVFIWLFIFFFVRETKGYTLEETATLYDGIDAIAELQRTAELQAELNKFQGTQQDGATEAGPKEDVFHLEEKVNRV